VSLRKQGANKGATTAFLISTPESGVDSISITYALMDPIMTVARPAAAFVTSAVAGVAENIIDPTNTERSTSPDLTCPVDGCCDGKDCPPEKHRRHHSSWQKIQAGIRFALTEYWKDIAGWFFIGLFFAGIISAIIPDDVFVRYMGAGGLTAMLIMLAMGMPLYICATASTPIAAALILKGISPGAALVFLLVGPATNVTSLTVLFGLLGKKATAIYFVTIACVAVLFGLAVDQVYLSFGLSPQAMMGKASEIVPEWIKFVGVFVLLIISIKPLYAGLKKIFAKFDNRTPESACNCSVEPNQKPLPISETSTCCPTST
jgi:uncharacterized membrane protein YraQ (UPF0718 family)